MSSVDHLNDSAADLASTTKQRTRKKNSVSSGLHSPKMHVSESGGKIHGSHTFSGGQRSPRGSTVQRSSEQNKALGVDHIIWTGLIVEIGVDIEIILLLCFF